MSKQAAPKPYRPWPEAQTRLDYVTENLDMELNTFLNELVTSDEAKKFLETLKAKRAKALAVPVP